MCPQAERLPVTAQHSTRLEQRRQSVVHVGLQLPRLQQRAEEVGFQGRSLLGLACGGE
jgi:hypothetical protein